MKYELHRWKEKYVSLLPRYAGDSGMFENMPDDFPRPFTQESARRFMDSRQLAEDSEEYARAIIIDGEVAGSVLIRRLSGSRRCCASVEFWLGEPFRERGIMSAALREACSEAFKSLGVTRIHAEVPAPVSAARGALNNAGFDLEGRLDRGVLYGGRPVELCVYGLIKEENDSLYSEE